MSRVRYLRRNLTCQHHLRLDEKFTHHPPDSVSVASYASVTGVPSSPLSDMAGLHRDQDLNQSISMMLGWTECTMPRRFWRDACENRTWKENQFQNFSSARGAVRRSTFKV